MNAVRNCRTKALSIAQYLNQTLGSALTIREEKTIEFVGNSPAQEPNMHNNLELDIPTSDNKRVNTCKSARTSVQQRIADGTVTVHVQIYAEFECKERTRKSIRKMTYIESTHNEKKIHPFLHPDFFR